MPLSPQTLRKFLQRVDHEVLRLGTREHVVAERIAAEARQQGWPQEELGDALASALATDREEWQEIRRLFRLHSAPPEQSPPSRAPYVLLAVAVVLGLGLVLLLPDCPPGPGPDSGGTDGPTAADLSGREGPDLRPPTPADLGCWREPLKEEPRTIERSDPVPRAELAPQTWLALAAGTFALSLLGLLLVRLRSYLRRRLAELIERTQEAQQARKDQRERQQAAGRAQYDELAEQAAETGKPTRPTYRLELQPPVPSEIVEDCATHLGRAFQAQVGDELDLEGTLAATVEQGGAVQPVFLPRRAVRELILAYDVTARPYLPGFLKLVSRWQRLGVQLTLLQFVRHPSTLSVPESRARSRELADLARQGAGASLVLFASRLMLRSRERDLGWPQALRGFPVHAWLDPDPRLPEERETDAQAELQVLEPLLPRFPLTKEGLLALARYIGRPEEGPRPPPWAPPLPLGDPHMARWIDLWLALGAQVPDAAMDQFEAVRQKLLAEHLPDPRSIGRLLERLRELLGSDFNPTKATVELSVARRLVLLLKLLKEERGLLRRGFALLLESLGTEPKLGPGEKPDLVHYIYRLRRRWYLAGLALADGQPAEGLLDELDGTPMHEAAQEVRQLVQALATDETVVPEPLEVERRPERLGWKEARVPRLVVESAVLAVLVAGVLLGGLRLMKRWPQEVVIKETRLAQALDERVKCPERPKAKAEPPTPEPLPDPKGTVPKPQPTAQLKLPARPRPAPAPVPRPPDASSSATAQDAGAQRAAAVPDLAAPAPDLLPPRPAYRPKMIPLRAGSFLMGSKTSPYDDERPQHEVVLTVPFQMSETEVTKGQYQAVMGKNPSRFQNAPDATQRPVENVSFEDAARYCNKLSALEGAEACYQISGDEVQWPKKQECKGYRLPTEAEWEYAARAGQKTEYAGSDRVDEVAWIYTNSEGQTHPVAKKNPNTWGLYDLSGNVWEWVWDKYGASYKDAGSRDPIGVGVGSGRVVRGGSWSRDAEDARVADRYRIAPAYRGSYVGFRLARSYP